MQKSTKILLGIFVISLLVAIFGGNIATSTQPPLGASVTEIQNHFFFVTLPFALVNFALLVSAVLLVIRGIRHYFRKS